MADSIFEPDELEAEALAPDADLPEEQAPARDEHGRFAPKEQKPEEEPGHDPDAPEPGEAKSNTVPQGALHAERERRKGVEAELAAVREQLGQIAVLRRKAAERKPAELPAQDDPAAMEHLRARLAEVDQRQTTLESNREQEALDQRELQQLGTIMAQSEAAYRQEKPDYDEAIQHVITARAQELQLYGMDPMTAQNAILGEIADIARMAVQQGKNPAEMGYQIAMSRGYRPAEQQQQQQGGAAATVEAIRRAQDASKTLGSGGGSSATKLNAESIAALSDDEFDALYATAEGRALIDNL